MEISNPDLQVVEKQIDSPAKASAEMSWDQFDEENEDFSLGSVTPVEVPKACSLENEGCESNVLNKDGPKRIKPRINI